MNRFRSARLSLVFLFVAPVLFAADTSPGASAFRSNCAFCHGLAGKGGRGPSLVTARVVQDTSDDALKTIVRHGIAGTGMPAFELEDEDLNALVAHIRRLGGNAPQSGVVPGDAAHGKQVYAANGCAGCHATGLSGSVYGPELTRIGSARSPEYLRESIVDPSADIVEGYGGATVVTRSGSKVTGVILNQDSFSIQLRLRDESFAFFRKSDLQSSEDLTVSLMPSYSKLPAKDLEDLIAYLATLRGGSAGADVTKAKGIH